MYEYIGNIHMHSTYSDGGYKIDKIAKEASKAGLDFIVITDHETLAGLHNGEEGYHHNVLTLIGEEVNDTANHYLALDIDEVVPNNTENPQKVIDAVNNQGGIGIIAHPLEIGSPFYEQGITYNWTACDVTNFQGIEIWNYLSQWKGSINTIKAAIYYFINPHPALTGPYSQVMQWLDELQARGEPIMVFGGSDAHNVKIKLGPLTIAKVGTYKQSFKCINMHILTDHKFSRDFIIDKKLVYKALKAGNSWVGYDFFKNSKGFRFLLKNGEKIYPMGSRVKLSKEMLLEIRIPYTAQALVMKSGQVWKKLKGDNFRINVDAPGVYRIEVYHKHGSSFRPWIFSNSIWVV